MKDYEYVGGGYFREKGIEKGKVAEIIHAPKLVENLKLELAQASALALRLIKESITDGYKVCPSCLNSGSVMRTNIGGVYWVDCNMCGRGQDDR